MLKLHEWTEREMMQIVYIRAGANIPYTLGCRIKLAYMIESFTGMFDLNIDNHYTRWSWFKWEWHNFCTALKLGT
jgi:uncharacterized metal-binding protein